MNSLKKLWLIFCPVLITDRLCSMAFFLTKFLRNRWKLKKLEFCILCFSVSSPLFATFDLIETHKQVSQENNLNQEMARLVSELGVSDTQKISNTEYSEEKYGDFAILLRIFKRTLDMAKNMWSEINTDCEKLQDILTPSNLCDPKKNIEAKKLVSIYSATLDRSKKNCAQDYVLKEAEMKAFILNKKLPRNALEIFEKSKTESKKIMDEFFNNAKKYVKKLSNILDFATKISLQELDGGFIFKNEEEIEIFNQLIDELIEIEEEEAKIIKKQEILNQSVFQHWY